MYNIGFVGKGGAGKSYLCNYLKQKYGYIQAKMASSLYAVAGEYFGMTEKTKDRRLLQFMGTDVGRVEISNDIWVNRFLENIYIAQRTSKELYNKEMNFCSDDVRFKNEYLALKQDSWKLIYLDVPDEIRIKRLTTRDGDAQLGTLGHVSELEIDTFKHQLIQLDASGSLDETYEKLETLLESFENVKS